MLRGNGIEICLNEQEANPFGLTSRIAFLLPILLIHFVLAPHF